MYRTIMISVLLFLSLLTLAYAIYRSVGEKITIQEGARQTVYGEPQHGLVFGLCFFAAVCVAGAVALLFNRREVRQDERVTLSKRVP